MRVVCASVVSKITVLLPGGISAHLSVCPQRCVECPVCLHGCLLSELIPHIAGHELCGLRVRSIQLEQDRQREHAEAAVKQQVSERAMGCNVSAPKHSAAHTSCLAHLILQRLARQLTGVQTRLFRLTNQRDALVQFAFFVIVFACFLSLWLAL